MGIRKDKNLTASALFGVAAFQLVGAAKNSRGSVTFALIGRILWAIITPPRGGPSRAGFAKPPGLPCDGVYGTTSILT